MIAVLPSPVMTFNCVSKRTGTLTDRRIGSDKDGSVAPLSNTQLAKEIVLQNKMFIGRDNILTKLTTEILLYLQLLWMPR